MGIPELYKTENVKLEDKIICNLYRGINKSGASYWLVVEQNFKTGEAFGYVSLAPMREFAEWGYFNISDLIERGVEICIDWEPVKFKEAKERLKL